MIDIEEKYHKKPMKYKEICELFNEEMVKGSGGKRKQLKIWQQYYDIEKIGMYFIIKRKYNEDEIKLIEENGKFSSYITDLLKVYLSKKDDYIAYVTYDELLELTYLVNQSYNRARQNVEYKKEYKETKKFDVKIPNVTVDEIFETDEEEHYYMVGMKDSIIQKEIKNFFKVSKSLLKRTISDSLKIMREKSLLTYSDSFRFYYKEVVYSDKEKTYYKTTYKDATDEQISAMLTAQNEALELIGLTKINQLNYLSRRKQEDKIKLNTYAEYMLKKANEISGCTYYGRSLKLILANEALKKNAKYINKNIINGYSCEKLRNAKDMQLFTLKDEMIEQYININANRSK